MLESGEKDGAEKEGTKERRREEVTKIKEVMADELCDSIVHGQSVDIRLLSIIPDISLKCFSSRSKKRDVSVMGTSITWKQRTNPAFKNASTTHICESMSI